MSENVSFWAGWSESEALKAKLKALPSATRRNETSAIFGAVFEERTVTWNEVLTVLEPSLTDTVTGY